MNDAQSDSDGDGFSNAEEYAAGSDPQDADSKPEDDPEDDPDSDDPTPVAAPDPADVAVELRIIGNPCSPPPPIYPSGLRRPENFEKVFWTFKLFIVRFAAHGEKRLFKRTSVPTLRLWEAEFKGGLVVNDFLEIRDKPFISRGTHCIIFYEIISLPTGSWYNEQIRVGERMRTKNKLFAISLALLMCWMTHALPAHGEEVTLAFCEDPWPPYTIGEMGHPPTGGIAIAYFKHVFEQIDGLDLEIQLCPWTRCLNRVKRGTVDGVLLALHSEERAQYMEYSIPYYESRVVFFYNRKKYPNGLEIDPDTVWSQYSIGHVDGFTFGETFEQAKKDGVQFDTARTPELCLQKLYGKRFDLYLENELAGKSAMAKLGYEGKIGIAVPALESKKYHLALSKRSPALSFLPKINEALQKSIEDGTRDRFFEAHD